jgi:hypothetical protein
MVPFFSTPTPEDGMNVRVSKVLFPALALAAILVGCSGASKSKMNEIQSKIKALTDKGTPDIVLTNVKVFQYNVASAQKINNAGDARRYTDSMIAAIAAAEKWYADAMVQDKAYLDSKGAELKGRKAKLTGLTLRAADSIYAIIDSFTNINWLVPARAKMMKLDSIMPDLEKCEIKTAENIKKLTGKWVDARWVQPEEVKFKYYDKRVYTFNKDGKYEGDESRKGQTSEFFKEDWQFLSWGSYNVKGDTIFISVNREKCTKQNYTQLWVKENKWKEDKKPTYDSTITNKAKDRFMTFADLKETFKKM